MHQHEFGLVGHKRLEAGADRGLSGGATKDRGQDLEPHGGMLEPLAKKNLQKLIDALQAALQ